VHSAVDTAVGGQPTGVVDGFATTATAASLWTGLRPVSTREQNVEAQIDLLGKSRCEKVFIDEVSGKLARDPAGMPAWTTCVLAEALCGWSDKASADRRARLRRQAASVSRTT
jgi:hypothetical protein